MEQNSSNNNNSQATPFIATQTQPTGDDDQQQNEKEIKKNEPVVWGRLVSCHPDSKHLDLIDEEIIFGRNHKRCKIVLQDPTVSGLHCKIFRSSNPPSSNGAAVPSDINKNHNNNNNNNLPKTAWITDYSTNGTFIKGVNLGKGNSTLLQNGDTISFTSSKINSSLSFIFQDLLSSEQEDDIFDTDRFLYLVLELATGGELFEKIKEKGRYNEPEAKVVFKQILSAVSYLHQLNISHRDLKPENILISYNSSGESIIKVTDFGLAKIIGEKEIATTLCGTPMYVAPEIIKSCLYHDESSKETVGYGKEVDAWSLGCRPPFDVEKSNNFQQINKGLYSFEHAVWSTVTDQAKDLISKLLNVDPIKRIALKDALNHSWFTNDELYRYKTQISSPLSLEKQTPVHSVVQLPNQVKNSKNIPISLGLNFNSQFQSPNHQIQTNNSNNNNNINNTSPKEYFKEQQQRSSIRMLQFEKSPTTSKPQQQSISATNSRSTSPTSSSANINLQSKFLQSSTNTSTTTTNNNNNHKSTTSLGTSTTSSTTTTSSIGTSDPIDLLSDEEDSSINSKKQSLPTTTAISQSLSSSTSSTKSIRNSNEMNISADNINNSDRKRKENEINNINQQQQSNISTTTTTNTRNSRKKLKS
eukprot:gene565-710_t